MGDTHNTVWQDALTTRQALELRRSGHTLQFIADKLGLGSRQRVWQILKNASGLCSICGHPKHPNSKDRCTRCVIAVRQNNRSRSGSGEYAITGMGRPTIL